MSTPTQRKALPLSHLCWFKTIDPPYHNVRDVQRVKVRGERGKATEEGWIEAHHVDAQVFFSPDKTFNNLNAMRYDLVHCKIPSKYTMKGTV